jgi:nucleoside-diphosphate-sugar epimerase
MRIAVIGASGNVGSSLLRALEADDAVDEVVAIARRPPAPRTGKAVWRAADVSSDDLVPLLRGASAVVHLAWAIQPSHDAEATHRINVLGSRRVLEAAVEAQVGTVVAASSVGAYSYGAGRTVDESWPAEGVPTSFYSRHKAELERMLVDLAREQPGLRVAWLRPALTFQRTSASEQRRLFAGPFVPGFVLRSRLWPVLPWPRGLRFQAVHTDDVADAYRRAVLQDAEGPYNVAAEPVVDAERLGAHVGARPLPLPPRALRSFMAGAWRLRLQPSEEGWLDMALSVPLMETTRIEAELGWKPRRSSLDALDELAAGLRGGTGGDTPTLDEDAGGPARLGELGTRVGGST